MGETEPVSENKNAATVALLMEDITEWKEIEEKLNKANRLYAFISQVNQHIVRVKDEAGLFRNSCNMAVEFGKFNMSWIGLFDNTHTKVNLVAQCGLADKELKLFSNIPFQKDGPLDYLLRTGKYYVCNDIENDPGFINWKPFMAKHGFKSCIVLPIKKSDGIIGTFNLYTTERSFSNTEEIELLVKLIDDISFALQIFENEKKQKETEALLLKSEKQFRHTLDNMLEGAQIHDHDWRYVYVNDALVKYSTYPKEELIGYTLMEKYPGIEQTVLFKTLERCMNEQVAERLETEFVFPNGTKAYFELSIEPIPEGIFILSVDRTEQQKAREKLLKVNRMYAFLSAINQSIVHIKDERSLLTNACDIAINTGQFKLAWVGMLQEDGKLYMVNMRGDKRASKEILKNTGQDFSSPELRDTPTGRVLRTGRYAVSNDVQNDPVMKPWKEEFVQHGIKANISLPVKKSGKIIGVLGFNSTIENFFDKEEINLLEEASNDISFALENFEKAKKHKETEELLARNEKRFRVLIEKSADMKTLATRAGQLIYASPSVTKVLGYTPDEFLEAAIQDLIHPDDVSAYTENRKLVLQIPGDSFYFQHRIKHKTGRWIWCEGTVTNMLDEPCITAMVSNFRDISEKKIMEQQQEFDKNNLNALINNTMDLMWSVDRDLNIITSNQPFDEIMTLMSGKKVEKGSSILAAAFSNEQAARYKSFYERAFAGETFTETEYMEAPVEIWTEVSFHPMFKGDEVIGTACHSRNITERKHAELERTRMTNDLILRNKDLEQFTYIVSHNLRAPVANIQGIISLMNDAELTEEEEKIVTKGLNESVIKLDGIVYDLNHILEVKGHVNEVKENVFFPELVENIKSSIKNLIDEGQIEIAYDFSEADEFFTLKSYLYSIFFNLITNSIKYRRQEIPCSIKIRSRQLLNTIELVFSDNGLGIDLQKRGEQVFGLYRRFHPGTTGKGMGLFMVKTQVETLGGRISVTSEVNKGTEFKIEFEK